MADRYRPDYEPQQGGMVGQYVNRVENEHNNYGNAEQHAYVPPVNVPPQPRVMQQVDLANGQQNQEEEEEDEEEEEEDDDENMARFEANEHTIWIDSDGDEETENIIMKQNFFLPYSDHNYDTPDPSERVIHPDEGPFPIIGGLDEEGNIIRQYMPPGYEGQGEEFGEPDEYELADRAVAAAAAEAAQAAQLAQIQHEQQSHVVKQQYQPRPTSLKRCHPDSVAHQEPVKKMKSQQPSTSRKSAPTTQQQPQQQQQQGAKTRVPQLNQYSKAAAQLLASMHQTSGADWFIEKWSCHKSARRMRVEENVEALVTTEAVPIRQVIIQMNGYVSVSNEVKRNPGGGNSVFLYDGLMKGESGEKLSNGQLVCVDANGHDSKFTRRSCQPNCVLKHVLGSDATLGVMIVATQDIHENVEATLPFDIDWRDADTPLECAKHLKKLHECQFEAERRRYRNERAESQESERRKAEKSRGADEERRRREDEDRRRGAGERMVRERMML